MKIKEKLSEHEGTIKGAVGLGTAIVGVSLIGYYVANKNPENKLLFPIGFMFLIGGMYLMPEGSDFLNLKKMEEKEPKKKKGDLEWDEDEEAYV